MKKLIPLILTIAMLLSMTTVIADEEIKVYVDGEQVIFDAKPFIENDRTLVPIRAIAEKLGAEVSWSEDAQLVQISRWYILSFYIDSNKMQKDIPYIWMGTEIRTKFIELDAPAKIVNDRTYIPLRAVSEAFDCEVQWDEKTRTVEIISNVAEPTIEPTPTATPTITPTVTPTKKPVVSGGGGGGGRKSKTTPTPAPTPTPYVPVTYTEKLMADMPEDENYLISPFSLKMAMMMVANGADGETRKQILDALQVESVEEYNEFAKNLIERANNDKKAEVKIANSIWFNKGYYNIESADFSEDFKSLISEFYKGTAETVTNEDSIERVNEWVNENTNGKIAGILTEAQRNYLFSLANTIYMKAEWRTQFSEKRTEKLTFTDINGEETETDFLRKLDEYYYYENGDSKMVSIPYKNGFEMWFVLGDEVNFENDIEKAEYVKVNLFIPKFKTEYGTELGKTMQKMNVTKAFEASNYDFSGMVQNVPDPLKIEFIIQKTFLEIDENGTEAAAATVIGGAAGGGVPDPNATPEPIYEFRADKPFKYYIVDSSDEILFAGQYVKCE